MSASPSDPSVSTTEERQPADAPHDAEATSSEAPASPSTETGEQETATTEPVEAATDHGEPSVQAEPSDHAEPSGHAEPTDEAGATEEPSEGDASSSAEEQASDGQADQPSATKEPAAEAPTDAGAKQNAEGTGPEQEPDEQQQAEQKQAEQKPKKKKKKKPAGPDPAAIVKRIGDTSQAALAYVRDPDPKLSRMSRKHREAVIAEIPPVTAGALLGPDALCRHFLASAASGRYIDLFNLWDLFKTFPEECKPVLAQRQRAQEHARQKLRTATKLGLLGHAERVADDIDRAAGLPWRWLKEVLDDLRPGIVQRPAVLAAMMRRDESFAEAVPEDPSDRWLAEAARLRDGEKELPPAIDRLLGEHADRLPATLTTLAMAQQQYPDQVAALVDRIDLRAPDIAAMLAWARDHGHGVRLEARIGAEVAEAAKADRADGLARWASWRDRGVELDLPEPLAQATLEGLDLGRPETATLLKLLIDGGAELQPQAILDQVASENRMLGEKAYESFVCAGFDDIHLPLVLEGNPMVRSETRCPACQAWTWVRPGHEARCPHDGMPLGTTEQDAAAVVDDAVAGLTGQASEAGPEQTPAAPAQAEARPSVVPPAAAPRPAPPAPAPAAESAPEPSSAPQPEATPTPEAEVAPQPEPAAQPGPAGQPGADAEQQ